MRKFAAAAAALTLICSPLAARAAALPPAPSPAETFDVGMLHVEKYGSGSPVVLVPGLASGAWTWNGVIPHLAASHTVYSITLAGFSGRPAAAGDVTVARFDGDLSTLIASRQLVKPALVGHSLGGTLAIAYGEAHPDRIGSVIAVDGLPVLPPLSQMTDAQRSATAQQMAAGVRAQSDEQFAASQQQYMAGIGVTDAALAKETANLTSRSDRATVAAWLVADLGADFRPKLSALTVPLTEIIGHNATEPYSGEQKDAFYRAILAGAPKVNVVVIEGAKHFVMLDQPEPFSAALDRALAAK